MPEHAEVAIFEDEERAINELQRLLTTAGHKIVGNIAANREEAEELIRRIITGEITPDVILLDHHLTKITGVEVTAQLQKHESVIPTIGTSITPRKQYYADHLVPKWSSEFRQIAEFINDL